MKLILKNGQRVVKDNELESIDVAIEEGVIVELGHDLEGERVIDLKGKLITNGLVDIHVHFREPGFTDKETILSGSKASARGACDPAKRVLNTPDV